MYLSYHMQWILSPFDFEHKETLNKGRYVLEWFWKHNSIHTNVFSFRLHYISNKKKEKFLKTFP